VSPETEGSFGRFSTSSSANCPHIFPSSHHGAFSDSFVPMHPGYLRLTLTKHIHRGADPPAACTPPHDAKHTPHHRLDSPGTFIEKQISTTWWWNWRSLSAAALCKVNCVLSMSKRPSLWHEIFVRRVRGSRHALTPCSHKTSHEI
jgi:hypothetical protein